MKKLFILGLFLMATHGLWAAGTPDRAFIEQLNEEATFLRLNKYTGFPEFVRFREGDQPAFAQFGDWLNAAFSLEPWEEVRPLKVTEDQMGGRHFRYQLFTDGKPVELSVFIVHEKDGLVESVNAKYFPVAERKTESLSEASALAFALDEIGASAYMWENAEAEKHLKAVKRDPSATFFPIGELAWAPDKSIDRSSHEMKLSWKFDIYASQPVSRKMVYVDANDGMILWSHDLLQHGDSTGTTETKYSGTREFVTDWTGTEFRLRETGRGGGIETYDMNEETDKGLAVDFTDTDNYWDNFNAEEDEVAGDAHWGAEMVYDFYMGTYGYDSYDGIGSPVISYVHFDKDYTNAFWDGYSMNFGDGGGSNTPLTTLDILGHEFTHGITGYSAGLVYAYESGALNESFSDIFGLMLEAEVRPSAFNWVIGEEAITSGIRNMSNPGSFDDPDTYLGENWVTGTGDNGGVHTNSGVQNHWFYLLSDGGSGTNDNGESYSVTAIGRDKAAAISFRNLTVYLTPDSDYEEARYYAIQAAIDLYGSCSPEMISVMDAWHAVGVGGPFANTPVSDFDAAKKSFCRTPAEVNFSSGAAGAISYWWNFGDLSISTAFAPTKTYNYNGSYDVTLVVTGCAGAKDTLMKPDFIVVDEDQLCEYFVPNSGTDSIVTDCEGILMDAGGTGDYPNSHQGIYTIKSPTGTPVTVVFNSFKFQSTGDFLAIYDGPNHFSGLMGVYRGSSLGYGSTFTSTGDAMTFREKADASASAPGFELIFAACPVGVADLLAQPKFIVYPNPSTGKINLEWEKVNESIQVRMMDLKGKEIYSNEFSAGMESTVIDLTDRSTGIYLMEIRSGNLVKREKIILGN